MPKSEWLNLVKIAERNQTTIVACMELSNTVDDPVAQRDPSFWSLKEILEKVVEERRQALDVFEAMERDTYLIRSSGVGLRVLSVNGGLTVEHTPTPLGASMYDDEEAARGVAKRLVGKMGRQLGFVDVVSVREATEEAVMAVKETIGRMAAIGMVDEMEEAMLLSLDDGESSALVFVSLEELMEKRHIAALWSGRPGDDSGMTHQTVH